MVEKEKAVNAFGEEVPEIGGDIWEVPVEERRDDDEGPGSNALDNGDDMGGWTPEDWYKDHPEDRPGEEE